MKDPASAVLDGFVVVIEALPGNDGEQVGSGPPVFVRLDADGMDGQGSVLGSSAVTPSISLQDDEGNVSQAG